VYGWTNYFIKLRGATSLTLHNLTLVYGDRITEYVAKKITKSHTTQRQTNVYNRH
jgi:hypothetical protein